MSPGDNKIHYQKLPEPPTVTEVFRWFLGDRIDSQWNGRTSNTTLRTGRRLPRQFVNTPHRLEMEGGALWRKGTQGEDRVEINGWPQRRKGGWQWWRDGDSHLCGVLPAAAVGSRWRPSPARYSGCQCCLLPRCSASPGPPGRTDAEGSEVWARGTSCRASGCLLSPWWLTGFSEAGGNAGSSVTWKEQGPWVRGSQAASSPVVAASPAGLWPAVSHAWEWSWSGCRMPGRSLCICWVLGGGDGSGGAEGGGGGVEGGLWAELRDSLIHWQTSGWDLGNSCWRSVQPRPQWQRGTRSWHSVRPLSRRLLPPQSPCRVTRPPPLCACPLPPPGYRHQSWWRQAPKRTPLTLQTPWKGGRSCGQGCGWSAGWAGRRICWAQSWTAGWSFQTLWPVTTQHPVECSPPHRPLTFPPRHCFPSQRERPGCGRCLGGCSRPSWAAGCDAWSCTGSKNRMRYS